MSTIRLSYTALFLGILILGTATFSAPASAAKYKFTPAFQDVLVKAKKEGGSVWYVGSGRRTRAEERRFSKAFEKVFGFPLNIRFNSAGTVIQKMRKLISEKKAGIKPSIDIYSGGVNIAATLLKTGVVLPTDWKALGFSVGDIEPRVHGIRIWDNLRTAFYNTNMVKGADIPQTWDDLLLPKWKGKIITASSPSVFAYIAAALGEQKTYVLMDKLRNVQKIAFLPSITAVPTAVASGEFPIGVSGSIGELKNKGAPIAYVPFKKNVALPNWGVTIRNSPNPNGARAFLYFVTQTDEGKKLLWDIFGWSTRDLPGTDAAWLFTKEKVVDLPYKWYFTDRRRIWGNTKKYLGLK